MKKLNLDKLDEMTMTDLINLKEHLDKSFIKSDDKYNKATKAYRKNRTQVNKRNLEQVEKERDQFRSDFHIVEDAISRKVEGMRYE